jgi:MFS family permease
MLTGLRTIWSHPVLRAAMTLIMLVNTVGIGLDLAIIVLLRHQHVQSGVIGLVLGAGAVGGLAGAPLVKQLHRLRPGVLLISVCFVASAMIGLMALPFGPWWVAALTFFAMLGVPSIRVLVDVLVFRQTPDAERGRVIAAVMVLIGLGMPVGVFFTGMLLQYLSASAALLVLAGVLTAAVAIFGTRRELVRAQWPQQG